MKGSTSKFVGLFLFVALLVGTPLLSAKPKPQRLDCDGDYDHSYGKKDCKDPIAMPDSHAGPILMLTGGVLGAAILVQRRRKVTS